jgi:aspartyl-tRNA(Asn)/glutamyl-tRNA(Gln) amidotransferase subunit B
MNIPFDSYEIVIGFECHVQLCTQSKLFSVGANRYGAAPNSLVDIVDAGLPGILPVINKKAVEFAIKLGLAMSCTINRESIFARKHYFYPDLPKGYQISQFDKPICENGYLIFMVDGIEKSIKIRRIHIEEDAGKNTHLEGANASYVDFNRAGTPLLEVVTEPDLRTPKETMEALKALRQLVVFLGICDGNMQEGSLRTDANVSVRKTNDKNFGTRTETKNLNSFRFLGQAISFEARRQIIELEAKRPIHQETRLWDPNAKESRPMRSKEEAHDYRYFPDPDLLPLVISEKMMQEISLTIPELPHDKFKRYQKELGLSDFDAQVLTSQKTLASYFESAISEYNNPKGIANWIINDVLRSSKLLSDSEERENEFIPAVPATAIANLVKLIDEKIISTNIAKRVYDNLQKSPHKSPIQVVEENNWRIITDSNSINKLIDQIILDNPLEIKKYRAGKTQVFGFLMGQLMKLSEGQVDPITANRLMLMALTNINSDDNK